MGQGLGTPDRRGGRFRDVNLRAAVARIAVPAGRWQSQGRARGVGVLSGGSHVREERGEPAAGISMFRPQLAHHPLRWLRTVGVQLCSAISSNASQSRRRIAAERNVSKSMAMPTEEPNNAERWVTAMVGLLFVGIAIAIVCSLDADLSLGALAAAAVIGGLGIDALLSAAFKRRSIVSRIGPLP